MTRALRGDRGSIAPLVPVLGFVILLLGGLVIDASRLLNARGRAVAYAEEAARAGASAIQPGSSTLVLDERLAEQRVQDYCEALLSDPELSAAVSSCAFQAVEPVGDGDARRIVVRVAVELEMSTSLLGIVGVQTLQASGEARARAFEGVDLDDLDSDPPGVELQFPDEFEGPEDVVLPGDPEPVPDADGDGVPDDEDPAPDDPDVPVARPDADGDGVPDAEDPAPDDPDVPTARPDADGDGVPDAEDPAPDDPDVPTPRDTDGDGVPDVSDPAPTDPAVPGPPAAPPTG